MIVDFGEGGGSLAGLMMLRVGSLSDKLAIVPG